MPDGTDQHICSVCHLEMKHGLAFCPRGGMRVLFLQLLLGGVRTAPKGGVPSAVFWLKNKASRRVAESKVEITANRGVRGGIRWGLVQSRSGRTR